MTNDEQMDERLRRFLAWQAGQLNGTPGAHAMALRVARRSGSRTADRPRLVWTIVAVALTIALAAAAALVGSRLIERPPAGGLLVYKLGDDIYLADEDGAHPRKVTAGVPWANDTGGGPSYLLGDAGPAWAPDGRHLLFFDIRGAGASIQTTGHIADASGNVVATIPNIWVDATWSPDSTRIKAWTGGLDGIGSTQLSIFGIDGAVRGSVPLPHGAVRYNEYAGFWAPDGRSVYARLGPTAEWWRVPLDGSPPRYLTAADPLANDHSFTHDGNRLAFVDNPAGSPTLFVANADGTDPRALVVGQSSASTFDASHTTTVEADGPTWSPDDKSIAYDWVRFVGGTPVDHELRIVDVASGSVHTVVADEPDNITPIGWSPGGDKLLYLTWDQGGDSSLWMVNVDGTHQTAIKDADDGYWQPVLRSP